MRVAITGSSGLIGTALRNALEVDGHDVVRVVRGASAPHSAHWDI
ncbi:MAG: NAD-dependent epimerase/dehydratase family protein, partial [Acidimicrobiales bacterium]